METDNISEEELWEDLLGDLGDEPEPSCEDGWHSFSELRSLARHLSYDQLRERLDLSIRHGTREKKAWHGKIYYRKV